MSDRPQPAMPADAPRYVSHKRVRALRILEMVTAHSRIWAVLAARYEDGDPTRPLPSDSASELVAATETTLDDWRLEPYLLELPERWCARHEPEGGGIIVWYEDGYCSYSPYQAFADGYLPQEKHEDLLDQEAQKRVDQRFSDCPCEQFLRLAHNRLRQYMAGPTACAQTATAVQHLEKALADLAARHEDREARGVRGTQKP